MPALLTAKGTKASEALDSFLLTECYVPAGAAAPSVHSDVCVSWGNTGYGHISGLPATAFPLWWHFPYTSAQSSLCHLFISVSSQRSREGLKMHQVRGLC